MMKFVRAVVLSGILLATGANTQAKPNIVFFLVDDLGWQDTSLPFADYVSAQHLLYRTPPLNPPARPGG